MEETTERDLLLKIQQILVFSYQQGELVLQDKSWIFSDENLDISYCPGSETYVITDSAGQSRLAWHEGLLVTDQSNTDSLIAQVQSQASALEQEFNLPDELEISQWLIQPEEAYSDIQSIAQRLFDKQLSMLEKGQDVEFYQLVNEDGSLIDPAVHCTDVTIADQRYTLAWNEISNDLNIYVDGELLSLQKGIPSDHIARWDVTGLFLNGLQNQPFPDAIFEGNDSKTYLELQSDNAPQTLVYAEAILSLINNHETELSNQFQFDVGGYTYLYDKPHDRLEVSKADRVIVGVSGYSTEWKPETLEGFPTAQDVHSQYLLWQWLKALEEYQKDAFNSKKIEPASHTDYSK